MSVALGRIQQLAEYVALGGDAAENRVLELALDKIMAREESRLVAQRTRLQAQLTEFERRYNLSSADFYHRFEQGDMGDDADFVEWSATYEMVENLNARLVILRDKRSDKR
ncbi:MAG: hypothetical protein H8D78_02465 [Chloroflexi bacterium]|nr:hypothetical protein [Chloroflexota bacterium]